MSKLAGWWSKKLEGGKREGMSRKNVFFFSSGLVQTGIYTFLRVLPGLSIYITKHYLLDDKCIHVVSFEHMLDVLLVPVLIGTWCTRSGAHVKGEALDSVHSLTFDSYGSR